MVTTHKNTSIDWTKMSTVAINLGFKFNFPLNQNLAFSLGEQQKKNTNSSNNYVINKSLKVNFYTILLFKIIFFYHNIVWQFQMFS